MVFRSSSKGRERAIISHSPTLDRFQRQRWGKRLRDWVERVWTFPSAYRYHIERYEINKTLLYVPALWSTNN